MSQIIYLDSQYTRRDEERLTLVLGYFDGLHIGHQSLFEYADGIKNEKGGLTSVLLFDESPAKILSSGKSIKCITSLGDKVSLLECLGVDIIYLVHVDEGFLATRKDEFMDMVEYMIRPDDIVIGTDYTFGHKAEGKVPDLEARFGDSVHAIELMQEDGKKVSSKGIIKLIEEGKIAEVNGLLGRDYSIVGEVVKGLQNGRTIGFPTANLSLMDDYVLPKVGVYGGAVYLSNGDAYPSIINVGSNPTVKEETPVHVEAYLDGFDGDIYGEYIQVAFSFFIREETTFKNLEELKEQLSKDINTVR